MTPLQILPERLSHKITLINVIGQMDESNIDIQSKVFYDTITLMPEGGILILNFSELTYMNSKSIGYTNDFFNKMTEKNGAMIIAECQDNVYDVLNLVGLPKFISFESTVKLAKEKAFSITEENPELSYEDNSIALPETQEEVQEETPSPEPAETPKPQNAPNIQEEIPSYQPQKPQEEGNGMLVLAIFILAILVLIVGVFL